jgi:hypothetical protein
MFFKKGKVVMGYPSPKEGSINSRFKKASMRSVALMSFSEWVIGIQ